jgi:hypothetical protein
MQIDALNRTLNRNLFMLRKAIDEKPVEKAPTGGTSEDPKAAANAQYQQIVDTLKDPNSLPPGVNAVELALRRLSRLNTRLGFKPDYVPPELSHHQKAMKSIVEKSSSQGETSTDPKAAANAQYYQQIVDILKNPNSLPPGITVEKALKGLSKLNTQLGLKPDYVPPEISHHQKAMRAITEGIPQSGAKKTADLSQIGTKAAQPRSSSENALSAEPRENKSTSPVFDIGGGKSIKEQKENDGRVQEAQKVIRDHKGENLAPVGATGNREDITKLADKNITDAPLYSKQAQYVADKVGKMGRSDLNPEIVQNVKSDITKQNRASMLGQKTQSIYDAIQQKQRKGLPLRPEETEWMDTYNKGGHEGQKAVQEQKQRREVPMSVAEQTANYLKSKVKALKAGQLTHEQFQKDLNVLKASTNNKIQELQGSAEDFPNHSRIADMLGVHLGQIDQHLQNSISQSNPAPQAPKKQVPIITVPSKTRPNIDIRKPNQPQPEPEVTPETLSSGVTTSNPMAYKHPSQYSKESLVRIRSKKMGSDLVGTPDPVPSTYQNPQPPTPEQISAGKEAHKATHVENNPRFVNTKK